MRTHWSCLITEVSKLITHFWCSLDSNMGLYYTEDGSYRMVHLHYMPPNDKLNSRDLTTILFSVYVQWVQPLSATWFRLQVDRLGLTDERGSRPCFYAWQLQLVCVRPSVSCSLRCLHLWCWTLMLNNPIFCLCTVFFFYFFLKITLPSAPSQALGKVFFLKKSEILCRVPKQGHSAKKLF